MRKVLLGVVALALLAAGCGESAPSWPRYGPVEEMACDRPDAPSKTLEFRYVTSEFVFNIYEGERPSSREIRWSSDSPWEEERIDDRVKPYRKGPGWPPAKVNAPYSFGACSSEWTANKNREWMDQ